MSDHLYLEKKNDFWEWTSRSYGGYSSVKGGEITGKAKTFESADSIILSCAKELDINFQRDISIEESIIGFESFVGKSMTCFHIHHDLPGCRLDGGPMPYLLSNHNNQAKFGSVEHAKQCAEIIARNFRLCLEELRSQ